MNSDDEERELAFLRQALTQAKGVRDGAVRRENLKQYRGAVKEITYLSKRIDRVNRVAPSMDAYYNYMAERSAFRADPPDDRPDLP